MAKRKKSKVCKNCDGAGSVRGAIDSETNQYVDCPACGRAKKIPSPIMMRNAKCKICNHDCTVDNYARVFGDFYCIQCLKVELWSLIYHLEETGLMDNIVKAVKDEKNNNKDKKSHRL